MPKIEIEIGADNSDLKRKISEAEFDVKQLAKVKVDRIKLGLDTTQITAQIKDTKSTLLGLRSTLKDTGDSFSSMKPKIANGSNALMQFSRIAQDAPYGIIGIGNNITATAEAFGHLKQSTGSAGGALKAMAGSLLGTGGVLLAVSLVTTALTYMSQNGITVGDVFNKLTGNFDAVGSSMKKAFEESAKSALEETGALKGLVAVAQSEIVSREARAQAVETLQNKYPAHFGNLSKETIMYGNLEDAIKAVSKALINKGIADKLATDAVGPAFDLLTANSKLILQKNQQIKLEKDLAAELQKTKDGGFGGASNKTVNLKNAIKNNGFAINETTKDVDKLTKVVEKYERNIARFSVSSAELSVKATKTTKANVPTTKKTEKFVNKNPNFNGGTGFVGGGIVNPNSGIFAPDLGVDKVAIESAKMVKELSAFDTAANEIIEGSLVYTFANIGNAIGDALANGGNVLKAAGGAVIEGLSGLLSAMGGKLIELGTAAVLAGTVTKLFGTITGVGAGLAAIAGGIALKGIASSIVNRGGGVGNQENNRASTNSGGNSFRSEGATNSGFSGNSSGGQVVFRISGQDLVGVLSNTLDNNSRLGGAIRI